MHSFKNLHALYKHFAVSHSNAWSFMTVVITFLIYKSSSIQVMVDYLAAIKDGYSVLAKAYESGPSCSGFLRIYDKWYGIPYHRVDTNKTDLLTDRHSMSDFSMPYEVSSMVRKGTLLCIKNGKFVKAL